MIPDTNTPLPGDFSSENEKKERRQSAESFESDTQKIVRRHMEDADHQITDEEMANIRVGMNPPELDQPTKARLEGEDAIDNVEENILKGRRIEEDENTGGDKITPWDIKES